jgi:hypothetical protein
MFNYKYYLLMTANNGNRLHVDMMLSSSILLNIVHNIEEEVSSTFGCTEYRFLIDEGTNDGGTI